MVFIGIWLLHLLGVTGVYAASGGANYDGSETLDNSLHPSRWLQRSKSSPASPSFITLALSETQHGIDRTQEASSIDKSERPVTLGNRAASTPSAILVYATETITPSGTPTPIGSVLCNTPPACGIVDRAYLEFRAGLMCGWLKNNGITVFDATSKELTHGFQTQNINYFFGLKWADGCTIEPQHPLFSGPTDYCETKFTTPYYSCEYPNWRFYGFR